MKPLCAVALASLAMGCGGRVGGAGSGVQSTSDGAPAALDRGGAEDSGVPEVGPSDVRPMEDQDSPAPDITQGPTVWVGQINRTVTWPWDYDGGGVLTRNDLATVVPGPEKVVLIVDTGINPLIGTITFGDVGPPSPPKDPNQPYPLIFELPDGEVVPPDPVENLSWMQSPLAGFSYSLVSSTRSGNLLQLAFVPAQIFQSWCAIQDSSMLDAAAMSPCICDGGACTAPSSPIRQLTLTESGDSMQGQLFTITGGAMDDIRLQRVQ